MPITPSAIESGAVVRQPAVVLLNTQAEHPSSNQLSTLGLNVENCFDLDDCFNFGIALFLSAVFGVSGAIVFNVRNGKQILSLPQGVAGTIPLGREAIIGPGPGNSDHLDNPWQSTLVTSLGGVMMLAGFFSAILGVQLIARRLFCPR